MSQRVIIWTNYGGPTAPVLHTKPQGHWLFGSGEEDFWRIFTLYVGGGHLGHVTQTPRINFRSHDPWRLQMKFGFGWPRVLEKKIFENGGGTDDRRLYYKLTNVPEGSGELKKKPPTPTECTIHFGTPVVPDEYIINRGWLNGTCSNLRSGILPSTSPSE